MRLDVLLAQAHISRKKMKQALLKKEILVDDCPARKLSQNVDTSLQTITIEKQPIFTNSHQYFMMNKPPGVVTANSDMKHQTVLDLIRPEDFNEHLYSVGRLDRDTSGLLLITDNGPLGFQLLHPQYHITKMYEVEVNGLLDNQMIKAFQKGIVFLDETICKPALLTIHSSTPNKSTATVKKMFLTVGVKVTSLKRTHFGAFELDPNLAAGEYRAFNQSELEIVKHYLEKSY
ncbi:pseudouridine synthase [Streptococcus milleri]